METVDLKKELKAFYAPSAKAVSEVTAPAWQFLMIDGAGDPNTSPRYQQVVETLYSVSYTLKFLVRAELNIDYPVMALEGLWWVENMREFALQSKDSWFYTMMIMQPDFITPALLERAMTQAAKKKDLPLLPELRLETFAEGLAAQIMHIGPFSEEGPTVEKLHCYIHDTGHTPTGKHHEIYLTDIRRAAPERWKTVLRQPMG